MTSTKGTTAYGWYLFLALSLLLLVSVWYANTNESVLAWLVGIVYVSYDTWLLSYVAWKTRGLLNAHRVDDSETFSNTRASVAVLIPARNEAQSIVATVDCLLNQIDQPEKIIVVDDGSDDDSFSRLQQRYGFPSVEQGWSHTAAYPRLMILRKPNSGKADSLNQALRLVKEDIVITVDADTLLAHDAIAAVRRTFSQRPSLVAACGILTPRQGHTWRARLFTWFQHFEYLRAFLARAAWVQSNALLLVSGAFAAYRRSALMAVGGYDDRSLVEDYELIHRMHRHAHLHQLQWHVDVIHDARASTDVPSDLLAFLRQRRRWFAGFLRTQFHYRDMVGAKRFGAVGRLMLPIKTADTLQPIFGLTAFYFLCRFIGSDLRLAIYALIVIAIKLTIDFCYHVWALHVYHRWVGLPLPSSLWWRAIACTLAEPFCFQLARHCGALLGWFYVLSNKSSWVPVRHG